jgi:hypothetical protein
MTRRLSRGTLDTVLNVASEAELAEYFAGRAKWDPGRVWDGFFKPMLDALDESEREEVLTNVSNYRPSSRSGAMERGPAGSLASTSDKTRANTHDVFRGGRELRQWRDATSKVCEDINERNRKFYGQPSLRW